MRRQGSRRRRWFTPFHNFQLKVCCVAVRIGAAIILTVRRARSRSAHPLPRVVIASFKQCLGILLCALPAQFSGLRLLFRTHLAWRRSISILQPRLYIRRDGITQTSQTQERRARGNAKHQTHFNSRKTITKVGAPINIQGIGNSRGGHPCFSDGSQYAGEREARVGRLPLWSRGGLPS